MMKAALLAILLLLAPAVSADMPLMWEFKPVGAVSTDLVLNGGVLYFGTSSGRVYGLNASTGRLMINYTVPSGVYSTPYVSDGQVVFGCDNGVLYSFNTSSTKNTWTFMAKDAIRAPTASSGDILFVGSNDNRLYALKKTSGNRVWDMLSGPVQSPPLSDGWKIYFSAQGSRVYSVSVKDGSVIWNRTLPGQLKISNGFYDDIIYFTSTDKRVYALDKYTGDVLWNYTTNGSITLPPLVAAGNVIVSSSDRRVYSLDPYFGNLVWKTQLNETPTAPLSYDGETVYAPAGNRIYALSVTDGVEVWRMNISSTIRYRPAYSGSTLYLSGASVQAYGGSSDLEVLRIESTPQIPSADRKSTLSVTVRNSGSSIAADAQVDIYVDRMNVSGEKMTLTGGETAVLKHEITLGYGRHVVEAIVDKDNKLVESNKTNNRLGAVIYAQREWPTFKQNNNRTGYYSVGDRFTRMDSVVSWTCAFNASNMTLSDASLMFQAIDDSKPFRMASIALNHTCSATPSRIYPVNRITSNISCIVYNTTGYSDKNMNLMREYLRSFNETEYNWSIRHGTIEYPFNVTGFSGLFNCTASGNQDIPIEQATMVWDCRVRPNFNITPYNITGAWACTTRYYSNYSMEGLSQLKGYAPIGGFTPYLPSTSLSDYRMLWSYKTVDKIQSSPILVDLDGTGLLETVFGSFDGSVYAVDSEGRLLWESVLGGAVTSVAASDLDDDGRLEILAGTFGGSLYCLDSRGKLIWSYATGGPVESTPLVLEVGEPPHKEVIFGSLDDNIYSLSDQGRLLWSYKASDKVSSSATAADVDGDGELEVAIGSQDNILYVLRTPPYKVWMFQTNGDVNGAPIAVYGRYGKAADIITASSDGSLYDLYYSSMGVDQLARVCDSSGCRTETATKTRLYPRWQYQTGASVESSPAAADVNGDGSIEYVFAETNNEFLIVNRTGGRVVHSSLASPIYSTPALVDLVGDGSAEVILGSDDGTVYILNASGETAWSYKTNASVRSSAAIADVNGDGRLEFAIGSDDGSLYMFSPGGAGPQDATSSSSTSTSSTSSTTTPADEPSTTSTEPTSTTASTSTTSTSTTESSTTSIPQRINFPSGKDDLGAFIISVSILAYYFFTVMSPNSVGRKKSKLT